MSEIKAIYEIEGENLPATLDAFRGRRCTLPYRDQNYQRPTPEEVGRLISLAGWSQTDVAKIVGVSYNMSKGSSTIRKWKAAVDKDDSRPIPYAAWRLMLIEVGVVEPESGLTGK